MNPPQHGFGVTGKSSTPRKKNSCLLCGDLFALLLIAIYFEQFTLLELEFILVILGCKPSLDIGFGRSKNFLVVLIKFV